MFLDSRRVFFNFLWICGLVGLLGAAIPQAGATDKPSIEWLEPSVSPGKQPNFSQVTLRGRTAPGTKIQVDPKSMVIIQASAPGKVGLPRARRRVVLTNDRGLFAVKLTVPNGLLQVPLVFRGPKGGAQTSILLTMRVDPDAVSLNVPVVRRRQRVIQVIEAPPPRYAVGLAWSPGFYHQDLSLVGEEADLNLGALSALSLNADFSVRYTNWWWVGEYGASRFKTSGSTGELNLSNGSFVNQQVLVGGKYRLTGSLHELWLVLDVDGLTRPLMADSQGQQVVLVDFEVYRVGLGLGYSHMRRGIQYGAQIDYKEPFAIKVKEGLLAYESKGALRLRGEVNCQYQERWLLGVLGQIDYNLFSYEYRHSDRGIFNMGRGSIMNAQLMFRTQLALDGLF